MKINELLDQIDWSEIWSTISIGETVSVVDDDNLGDKKGGQGALHINFRQGNFDACINITGLELAGYFKKNLIFKQKEGGGDENVYKAICILAVAIKKSHNHIEYEEEE